MILSMHVDEGYVAPILEAGAVGYLLKYCADIELIPAVTAIAAGEVFVSPAIPRSVIADHGRATPRR
jgi:DNA-binding NarL/FixJ family response regulator